MTAAQNNLFIVEQLVRITAKEVRYLERTVNRLRNVNVDLAWVESLETSDEHSEMLDALYLDTGVCRIHWAINCCPRYCG